MKLTSYGRSLHELNILKDQGFEEVILEPKSLSRFGKLSKDEFLALSMRAKELGLRVLLEWDILMTEDVFTAKLKEVNDYVAHADAVRVQDPGAFGWVVRNTDRPLQFIAENGNHNLPALEGWVDLAKGRLERLILSIELSKTAIEGYVQKLKVPCELLGMGRILLFYTPRPLLSALAPEKMTMNGEIAALGESEESPHKGFPIVENAHGTFMFHIKEFCLVDFAHELRQMGLGFFRIDQRWDNQLLAEISGLVKNFDATGFETFKEKYTQDLMRGFYLVNKTDVLFPKLKNSRLQKREGDYIGEVLEAEKGSHLAIMVKNPKGLKKTDLLKILHPKGEIFESKIYSLRNLSLEEVDSVAAGNLAIIQFIGGVWVKSQVFYQ
ncbi:U32 family peptidase [Peredibacter starrii]|uniref:U32 family peptidase n=1 Tax=Peredibacter starrii TaxID=28202 RepID=A0AAX4HUX1_9BACT|nr:U32 family peptidase [Peredibacter starrii]WPU67191.1 U32 family peptidase [Peredibacter starrii]